uniref:GLTSCR1 domain-containing protein n=1 Tax=Syphacia muris TaxID=451379 RepID=A0A0N5A7U0_9BILA
MSSTGIRCIDDLGVEHYDDEWGYFGLDDDPLKGGSPPSSSVLDVNLDLSVPVRTCPSPLAQIPTREPYGIEAPPKLSPVPTEQEQSFTTLNTHVPDTSRQFPSSGLRTLADYENDLAEELGIFSIQPTASSSQQQAQPIQQQPQQIQQQQQLQQQQTQPQNYMQPTTSTGYLQQQPSTSIQSTQLHSVSPIFLTRQQGEVHMMQPSTSGTQIGGAIIQTQPQQQPQSSQQQQQQQQACIQTVNGQWFVQAQVQHMQTNSGTVIAVLPNYTAPPSRSHSELVTTVQSGNVITRQSPQQLQQQQLNLGIVTSQQQQHLQQQHILQQQQQQHQQKQQITPRVVHTQQISQQVMQTQKPAAVAISTMQSSQGLPVVQQLLSAPALPRQQMRQPIAVQQSAPTPTAKPKRTSQSRSSGRKKNVGQNGTLGSFLTKANRLAAASDGSTSEGNRSSLDSVTLSVQRLEQQTVQNVDCSREIKDLESKRAQIFFAALVEQHKNEDILSAASGQPKSISRVVSAPRQRNNYVSRTQVQHQVRPSTSYDRQSTFEPVQQQGQQTVRQYTSFQQVQYQPYQSTANQTSYVPVSSSGQVQQQVSIQQQYYQPVDGSRSGACNSYAQNFEQSSSASTPITASVTASVAIPLSTSLIASTPTQMNPNITTTISGPLSSSVSAVSMATVATTLPTSLNNSVTQVNVEPQQQIMPSVQQSSNVDQQILLPAPILKTAAENALSVREKRQQRVSKLSNYFGSLLNSVDAVDISKPFDDLSDIISRLFPFHVYHEPSLDDKVLDKFDHKYLRHMVYLNERKEKVEKRMRSLLFNEAMKSTAERMDELVLLSLDNEYESHALSEERCVAANNRDEFVSKSELCRELKSEEVEMKMEEFSKRKALKPQMPFEYHLFSEAEILCRDRDGLSDSETEGTELYFEDSATDDVSPSCSDDSFESVIDDEPTDKDLYSDDSKTETKPPCISKNIDNYERMEPFFSNFSTSEYPAENNEKYVQQYENMPAKLPESLEDHSVEMKYSPKALSPRISGGIAKSRKNSLAFCVQDVCAKNSSSPNIAVTDFAEKLKSSCSFIKHMSSKTTDESLPVLPIVDEQSTVSHSSVSPDAMLPPPLRCYSIDNKDISQVNFLSDKLKCHWANERLDEDNDSSTNMKLANEKIRLRIRTMKSPLKQMASLTSDRKETTSIDLDKDYNNAELPAVLENSPLNSCEVNSQKVTDAQSSIRTYLGKEEQEAVDKICLEQKSPINNLFPGSLKIKCNFRRLSENNDAKEGSDVKESEARPPIKIKIALPLKTDEHSLRNEDERKKEKKKKRKKKKHQKNVQALESDSRVNYGEESNEKLNVHNGRNPEVYEATCFSSCSVDDSSRGRLLLRFSRKQNNVVKCEPASSFASCAVREKRSSCDFGMDGSEPKPKVPKLKIPRIRLKKEIGTDGSETAYTLAVKVEDVGIAAAVCNQDNACEKRKLCNSNLKVEPVDVISNGGAHSPTPMVNSGKNLEAKSNSCLVKKPVVATNVPALTLNLFPASSSSSAQFSPDASDDEEEERLRLQTDNVMNRLNGWSSSLPVNDQAQAEALSRIVNTATFMNPLLGGLMTPGMNSWLTNVEQTRFSSSRNFPWLVAPPLLPQISRLQHRNTAAFDKTNPKR